MNLSDQVTSLALSKKLKELGVKAESLYAYYGNAGQWNDVIVDMSMYSDVDDEFKECKLLPAYTVAELGELLPWKLKASWKEKDETGLGGTWDTSINTKLEIEFDEGMCVVRYALLTSKKAKTEADARALMLIYLIEHSLIQL